MFLKRGLLGIGLGCVGALSQACGNTSSDPNAGHAGSSATAGSAGLGDGAAGDANAQGGSSTAGSASAGSGGSAAQGGDTGGTGTGADGNAAGEGGAIDEGGGTGGVSGGAGTAGTGGIDTGPQAQSSKLDVLMVIDNSVSMADKQDVLEATLPAFIKRVTNPLCVDANHKPVATQPTSSGLPCVTGTREFTANDIHVGVISTSLGAHGGSVCSAPAAGETMDTLDDRGELLGKLRPGLTTWQSSGFLSWDPSALTGSSSPTELTTDLTAIIVAAGDHGCGYEAPLEAMYRFLIDPEPPATVTKDVATGVTERQGTDTELLAERAAFLR